MMIPFSPDAQAKFAEASNAYTVLSNAEKREVYDREGEDVSNTAVSTVMVAWRLVVPPQAD